MDRLNSSALAGLPADVAQPRYDRRRLRGGIVHLGVGAFQRAHQAVVNEAALHASGDLRWGIVGVSLRSPDTRDALRGQDGLYTVALRDTDDSGRLRQQLQVVGGFTELLVAPEDPAAVLARIAAPEAAILSLTVTEKGYCHDPASGRLQAQHPDIVHDLAHPQAPRSALGFIVHGLALRCAAGLPPLTVLCCDNLPANGRLLRGLVLDFAGRVDAALQDWIATHCSFPCSMVDRIVPRTTDADRAAVAAQLGVQDAWPVMGEPFLDWVIEDDFVAGRPAWERGGARFVPEVQPYELMKLRLLNGTHSALAYLGCLAGWRTVDQAVAVPSLRAYLSTMMREEIAPTLPHVTGLDPLAYGERILARYANAALAHRTRQIAMDGSQKLPQRLLGTVSDRLRQGESVHRLALAVAAWLVFLRGTDEAGQAYTIDDPLAPLLAQRLQAADGVATAHADPAAAELARVQCLLGFEAVFGALGQEPDFAQLVARHTFFLGRYGVAATLEALEALP